MWIGANTDQMLTTMLEEWFWEMFEPTPTWPDFILGQFLWHEVCHYLADGEDEEYRLLSEKASCVMSTLFEVKIGLCLFLIRTLYIGSAVVIISNMAIIYL